MPLARWKKKEVTRAWRTVLAGPEGSYPLEWVSLPEFLRAVRTPPTPFHRLRRVDPRLPWGASNARWEDTSDGSPSPSNPPIPAFGTVAPLRVWARAINVTPNRLARLLRQMPVEEALLAPAPPPRPKDDKKCRRELGDALFAFYQEYKCDPHLDQRPRRVHSRPRREGRG